MVFPSSLKRNNCSRNLSLSVRSFEYIFIQNQNPSNYGITQSRSSYLPATSSPPGRYPPTFIMPWQSVLTGYEEISRIESAERDSPSTPHSITPRPTPVPPSMYRRLIYGEAAQSGRHTGVSSDRKHPSTERDRGA